MRQEQPPLLAWAALVTVVAPPVVPIPGVPPVPALPPAPTGPVLGYPAAADNPPAPIAPPVAAPLPVPTPRQNPTVPPWKLRHPFHCLQTRPRIPSLHRPPWSRQLRSAAAAHDAPTCRGSAGSRSAAGSCHATTGRGSASFRGATGAHHAPVVMHRRPPRCRRFLLRHHLPVCHERRREGGRRRPDGEFRRRQLRVAWWCRLGKRDRLVRSGIFSTLV